MSQLVSNNLLVAFFIAFLIRSNFGQNANAVPRVESEPRSQPPPPSQLPLQPPLTGYYPYPSYSQMSYAIGGPEQQMPYSYLVKPIVMSVPEITAFDFQTEDYRDQMEVEMQWINDRERLDEDAPVLFESDDTDEENDEEYDKNEIKDNNKMSENENHSNAKSLQILPLMPANEEVRDSDSNEDKQPMVEKETHVSQTPVESTETQSTPHLRRHKDKGLRKRKRNGVGRRIRRKRVKDNKPKEESQWKTVTAPDGKQILQRVLTLPSQTIELSNGYHAVGKKEIITEEEEVVTEKLKPVMSEEVIEMPSRKVTPN